MKFYFLVITLTLMVQSAFSVPIELKPPFDLGQVREISGNAHYAFYAIDSQGRLRAWGPGEPQIPANLGAVKSIKSKFELHCAILVNSQLRCWEDLADGSILELDIPRVVEKVLFVALDNWVICARVLNGVGYCWDIGWTADLSNDRPVYELPHQFYFASHFDVYGEGLCAIVLGGEIIWMT